MRPAPWCEAIAGGVRLAVQVAPNARKTEIAGVHDNALKIRLQAQPVEGQANTALLLAIARMLAVSKSAVELSGGQTSRRKTVDVRTVMSPQAVMDLLLG